MAGPKTAVVTEVATKVEKVVAKKTVLPTKQTLVEIRPIETKKWHGKTGPESFTRPKKLQALVDGNTTKYSTGLTQEEIVALKEEKGINYDLSDNYDTDKPHPFWDSPLSVLKLENATMFLDINQPLNYIKYKIAKASRFVANSMAEYEEGLFPDATHVIFSEMEQTEILASKVEIQNSAIIAAATLSLEKKIQIGMILGDKNLKGQSASFITVEMDKIIKKDAEEFLRYVNADAKQTAAHALILEALQKSILRKEGHRVLYMDDTLGGSVTEAAEYLCRPDNQDLKLILINKVNS